MANMDAYLDDYGKIIVDVSKHFYGGKIDSFYITNSNGYYKDCIIRGIEEREGIVKYTLTIPAEYDFSLAYTIHENHGLQAIVQVRFIVRNPKFDEMFSCPQEELGARYYRHHTSFSLWAPTATHVTLEVNNRGEVKLYPMKRNAKGLFRYEVKEDLKRATYVYYVEVNGTVSKTTDPYGLSSTANGERSGVIDMNQVLSIRDDVSSLPPFENNVDAVLYECSVRDMTSLSSSGTTSHSKFTSLCERNTKWKGHSTCFDYIVKLGVTHVQLMPVYDFATVDELHPDRNYNWGYDPHQWNCLEGSYSVDPNDPYSRVLEFRKLVALFHEYGVRVTLDLVLNHHYDAYMSAFHKTVPYYYFRYNESGYLSNGSFCGNDFDSTRIMSRKFILENVKMWMNLYGVDGFRFDLMGILDVDTMNQVAALAKRIKPNAMVYGEGWNLPTYLPEELKATRYNQEAMPSVAHFNDIFRDVVKGKTAEDCSHDKGYITGNLDMAHDMCSCLLGHTIGGDYFYAFDDPNKSINYLECHDNATTWDKMHDCCSEDNRDIRFLKQKMMIAATLFSQGVPFLHAGQEFCGTKMNNHNSYNAGDDINGMNWDRMVSNQDIVQYTRACIAIRRRFKAFHLKNVEEIAKEVSFEINNGTIEYTIDHIDEECHSKGLKVYINPSWETHEFDVFGQYVMICDEFGLVKETRLANTIKVNPHSIVVASKV